MHDITTPFAQVDFRGERRVFGLKRADRRYHLLTIGRTGSGKSNLLSRLIAGDIEHAEGVAVIDPLIEPEIRDGSVFALSDDDLIGVTLDDDDRQTMVVAFSAGAVFSPGLGYRERGYTNVYDIKEKACVHL
jgi:hypothetical protein